MMSSHVFGNDKERMVIVLKKIDYPKKNEKPLPIYPNLFWKVIVAI